MPTLWLCAVRIYVCFVCIFSYGNGTQVAKHIFGMSGEYEVSVTVTGRHYSSPGLMIKLPHRYTAVDVIDIVRLRADHNVSAMGANQSEPVKFTARLDFS